MIAMTKIIATRRILYKSKEYAPGDELPDDLPFKDIWIENGSAVITDDKTNDTTQKAVPASAESGAVGINVENSESEITLAGKVPVTEKRKKTPSKSKTPKKKVNGE